MQIFKWLHHCFKSKHRQQAQYDLGSSTKHLQIYSFFEIVVNLCITPMPDGQNWDLVPHQAECFTHRKRHNLRPQMPYLSSAVAVM